MKAREIDKLFNDLFQPRLQEKFDNAGKQIIFHDSEIQGILLSLDIDNDVINEAIENNCNLILTHHPLFFKSIKNIDSSESTSQIITLIDKRINVYSAHTNLDKLFYDKLARVLELPNISLLFPTDMHVEEEMVGFGIKSELEMPVTLEYMLQQVKDKLNLDHVIYSGDRDRQITNIAVINGSGGSFIHKILDNRSIDCIITGDIGYHHSKDASDNSVAVIDAGHYGTERILLNFLYDQVNDYLTKNYSNNDIQLLISQKESNPLKIF